MNKFPMGQLVATPNAIANVGYEAILAGVKRHLAGDWGDLSEDDKRSNDEALIEGTRLLSAYSFNNKKFWIITEWDRSVTTILMPEDY